MEEDLRCKDCELMEVEAMRRKLKCSVMGCYTEEGSLCTLPAEKVVTIAKQMTYEMERRVTSKKAGC